jgi:hypothetical protein
MQMELETFEPLDYDLDYDHVVVVDKPIISASSYGFGPPSEQSDTPRPERRVALISPERVSEHRATQAMKLLKSMFWAFREANRCNWTVSSPESADVVVVSNMVEPERFARWKHSGKHMVVIAPDVDVDIEPDMLAAAHVLVFPFRSTEVLNLLDRVERQLSPPSESDEVAPPETDPVAAANVNATPWAFVETLRALQEVQNADAWLVGRDGGTAVLWIKGDGSYYAAEPSIVHAIRRGAIDLSWLRLRQEAPPFDGPPTRAGIELAWFAGYHASDKPAPWLNLEKRFRMQRRPDLDLIKPSESQARVVNILAETASDLTELAACAQVSFEEAARTLNALAACDALAPQEPTRTWRSIARQIGSLLTRALSALLRASANFLDARASALAERKRSS